MSHTEEYLDFLDRERMLQEALVERVADAILKCMDCGAEWPESGEFYVTERGDEWYPDDVFLSDKPAECPECGYHDWGWVRNLQEAK